MATERVADRNARVVEVVGGIARHPEALHHAHRAGVPRRGERDDLLEAQLLEAEAERGPRAFRGVAEAPGVTRQPPADLDRGSEWGIECDLGEPGEPDERGVRSPLHRPQTPA